MFMFARNNMSKSTNEDVWANQNSIVNTRETAHHVSERYVNNKKCNAFFPHNEK